MNLAYMDVMGIRKEKEFIIGFMIMLFLWIPVIYFNVDMKYIIHDTLDYDLVALILRAKHLRDSFIPEFLGGMSKQAIHPSAPGLVLFFKYLAPTHAMFLIYISIAVAAYMGMYLCAISLLQKKWIAATVGVLFTLLPYYPLFGLSVMGQPWIIYAILMLWKKENTFRSYLIIFVFSIFSSIALVGYANIVIIFVLGLIGAIKQHDMRILGALSIMIIGFMLIDVDLLLENIVGQKSYVSHRTEWYWMVAHNTGVTSFGDIFKKVIENPEQYILGGVSPLFLLTNGMYHAASNHKSILSMSYIFFMIAILCNKKMNNNTKRHLYGMGIIISTLVAISIFHAMWWTSPFIQDVRLILGGVFRYFQADRFYFMYPCLWFLLLAYTLFFVDWFLKEQGYENKRHFLIATFVGYLLFQLTIYSHFQNTLVENYHAFFNDKYRSMYCESINDFYQPKLFSDIKNDLGRSQSQYRVCSIGMHPSIALFNGFYCIDGYSPSYDINYKRKFRKIIEKEINQNKGLGDFDGWGSRCYVFVPELWGNYYYTFGNTRIGYVGRDENIELHNPAINYEAIKRLGAEYIFSCVNINNSANLDFIGKYGNDNSRYVIFVYKIK